MCTQAEYEQIHQYSIRHRALIEASARCGCFYCGAFFSPADIRDWTDAGEGGALEGAIALCPRCGIDAVLPSAAPITLTDEFLRELRRHFF